MNFLVFGATAAISQATCLALVKKKHTRFYLIGRNPTKLNALSDQLSLLSPNCVAGIEIFDLRAMDAIPALVARGTAALGQIDAALIGHGTLLHRQECADNLNKLHQIADENFLSEVVCLNSLADAVVSGGVIAVVTSVAADAARPSSAIYSATKAALGRYCQGMRGVLWQRRIRLIEVKPGWVNTPMTQQAEHKFWAVEPKTVGQDIARAIFGKRPPVLYTPWFWRWIMLSVKGLPAFIYRQLH